MFVFCKKDNMNQKLLIIDGNSLINRAFYALPLLNNSKGQFTGAIFGFTNILVKLLQELKPTHVVVAFDHSRKTFRNELYQDYKANRSGMPQELAAQIEPLKQLLDAMGIVRIEQDGIEADDIIGTISRQAPFETNILSGDRDVFQLIDNKTKVVFTVKGVTETIVLDEQQLKQKFSYTPAMVPDLKALMGDSSDNIPGVAGVGPKTALALLEKYGTLEGVYENLENEKGALKQKLEQGKDMAFLSKTLATIKTDCALENFDIEKCKVQFPFSHQVYEQFEQLEFSSLLKRTELFENKQVQKPKQKQQTVQIQTEQDVENFVFKAQQAGKFAFYMLDKFEIAFNQNTLHTLSTELNFFSSPLEFEKALTLLKSLFEDETTLKITHNLKSHLHLFKKHNIQLKGKIFDLSIANYLINAGVKYDTTVPTANVFFEQHIECEKQLKDLELVYLYENIELPLTYVLCSMEQEGFKIDTEQLDALANKYNQELNLLTQQIYQVADTTFNINSPKQLAEVLFKKLGLKSYLNKKLSTNIDVLNELSDQHPIIPLVIRYRKMFKLYSTYIESYRQIVAKNGDVIHTVFNQTLTSTGRLSSSEPNLQNIPVRDDEGKLLRKLFVSKFENGFIVSADYNQIELRLLAAFSQDPAMMQAYKQGKDIHAITASQIFGVPLDQVSSTMRRDAKAVNFGIVYGISDFGLATGLGISRYKAKDYIEKYFETYKQVKTYMDKNVQTAKEQGMIRTLFGRLRRVNEINSPNYQLRQFGERVAMNMPLQGSASDIIKLAMIVVHNKLKEKNLKSKLILQIHDELIIDAAPSELEQVKTLLKQSMENVVKLDVDLPVEVSVGKTWFDCK